MEKAMESREPFMNHPRPDFWRSQWIDLNGTWEFAFGREEGEPEFTRSIEVPFVYQSKASGIGSSEICDVVWYRRKIPVISFQKEKRYLLHFGAADYEAQVWINGRSVGTHKGGYTPFSFDITELLTGEGDEITVRVEDRYLDTSQVRGKQMWQQKEHGCWYTGYSGIWQPVWIEIVGEAYIEHCKIITDIEKKQIALDLDISEWTEDTAVTAKVSFQGKELAETSCRCVGRRIAFSVPVDYPRADMNGIFFWTPETPDLYDIRLELKRKGRLLDCVYTYCGMRTVQTQGGRVLLNNLPYYQKLVLNQGYYPQGCITAVSDQDYIRDIQLIKQMGFNGVRMHQKIEDPRFLYWCDRLGLLVWEEMPSFYNFTGQAQLQYMRELSETVSRDYNHPCIVVWVAFNESWGVFDLYCSPQQQAAVQAAYYQFKALDQTRPVIGNDGWEHTVTDLCTIHDYEQNAEVMGRSYQDRQKVVQGAPSKLFSRCIQAKGFAYEGQPVLVSEFAGIAFEENQGWGYGESAKTREEYKERLEQLIMAVKKQDYICGYCITQLTDVEHEQNGLLCFDRSPKLPLEEISQMQEGL